MVASLNHSNKKSTNKKKIISLLCNACMFFTFSSADTLNIALKLSSPKQYMMQIHWKCTGFR